MFHHVQRRGIAEQPAGKYLPPGHGIRRFWPLLNKNLNKRARFGRLFPGQGALAGRQPHDYIADPPRLAGFHHQILGQIIALVEQANRRHPVLDRRAEFAFCRWPGNRHCLDRLRDGLVGRRCITAGIAAGCQCPRQRPGHGNGQKPGRSRAAHQAFDDGFRSSPSGDHA